MTETPPEDLIFDQNLEILAHRTDPLEGFGSTLLTMMFADELGVGQLQFAVTLKDGHLVTQLRKVRDRARTDEEKAKFDALGEQMAARLEGRA